MALKLSQPQQFLPIGGTTPLIQDWSPANNSEVNLLQNVVAGLSPNPFSIDFKIKALTDAERDTYSNIRFYCSHDHDFSPAPFDWLTITGLPDTGSFTDYNTNGVHFPTNFNFNNLALLAPGSYFYQIVFIIQGATSNGVVSLYTYVYKINLSVSSNTVTFSPSSVVLNHYQNTSPMASTVITMMGNNWTLQPSSVAGKYLELSTQDTGVTFGTSQYAGGSVQYAQGSGTKNIIVTLNSFYNTGLIPAQYLSGNFIVAVGTTLVAGIPFTVNIYNQNSMNVSPSSLTFSAVKDIQEPVPQLLTVAINATTFVVSNSPWLTVTDVNGYYNVCPIATANMSPGTYAGFVTFTAVISGQTSTITIPVSYVLDGFIVNPYYKKENAFTLDQDFFELNSANTGTFFEVNANIKIFDFFTLAYNVIKIPQKIVLFQGKSKFNLGQAIHRIMSRFTNPNEEVFQYHAAKLTLEVNEKNYTTGAVVRSAILQDIKFFAGIGTDNNSGLEILQFNPLPNSAKKNSFAFLNIIMPKGTYCLHYFKNSVFNHTEVLPVSNDFVICKKITFENYNPGDVIVVLLSVPDRTIELAWPQTKTYYILPEGKYNNPIIWEDEFLVQQTINCSGEYNIKTDFEFQSNKVFHNLVEQLNYVSTNSDIKLSINTGWLIQTDIDSVVSLMRSKKVWLQNDIVTVELRPLNKTITNKDSQRELIEYTLEFTINKLSNEKTYSF